MIKLDISITRGIDTDHASRAMAAALASFGREMDIVLVAEGIETPAERYAHSECSSGRATCSGDRGTF